ncbi:MAG: hypothetical protein Q9167_006323 [Letrouitia subvulpina]
MALDRVVDPRPWQKWILYGIPTLQFMSMIVSIALNGVSIRCLWSIASSKTCPDVLAILRFNTFNAALSAFTHAFLAVVPIAAFWRLPLPCKKKIGLFLLMGTNWLAAVCLIARNVLAVRVKSYTDKAGYNEFSSVLDNVWVNASLTPSRIEANVVLVAACIPSLRPFIISMRQTFRKKKSTSYLKKLGLHRRSDNSDPETLIPGTGHTCEQPKEEHLVSAEPRNSVRASEESLEQLEAGHRTSAEQEDQSYSRHHEWEK